MEFEECMYHLLSLDETLNPRFFVTQFVLGLKDELCTAVRLQAPTSVTHAVALARIQEEELETHHPRPHVVGVVRAQISTPKQAVPQAAAPRQDWVKRSNTDEYRRECQLRDFRRTNGLCFRCIEKYSLEY